MEIVSLDNGFSEHLWECLYQNKTEIVQASLYLLTHTTPRSGLEFTQTLNKKNRIK
jgi:hypothetical protein